MSNRENEKLTVTLAWTSKPKFGSVGNTHRASVCINGREWKFAVDQPRKGYWQVRGWVDRESRFFRDGTGMRQMRKAAQDWANLILNYECSYCHELYGHRKDCGRG